MTTENNSKYVWVIMLVLSLLFLAWTSLVFAGGAAILEQSLELAGSPMVTGDFDQGDSRIPDDGSAETVVGRDMDRPIRHILRSRT